MDEFEIPVTINGKELAFKARLLRMGYIYKIEVDLPEGKVLFERDEERSWRVISDPSHPGSAKNPDPHLLNSIAQVLDDEK